MTKEKAAPSPAGSERRKVENEQHHNNPFKGPFARLAPKLLDNGYSPIPVWAGTKEAACSRWSHFGFRQPTGRDLARWMKHRPGASVGLVGGRIVGVDLDVLDFDRAERLLALAQGLLGWTPLHRIGKAPKRVLVYRAKGVIASRSAALSCGNIDIIGEGRQFVAYGIHPETKREYSWEEGTGTPFNTPADSLPEVEGWQLDDLIARAAMIYPAPSAPGRKGHGQESGEIVRHPGTGLVINGRDTHLRDITLRHCSNRGRRSDDALVRDVWDEFAQSADTVRPRSLDGKPWSVKHARAKVLYTLRRLRDGKTRRASKVQRAPWTCEPVNTCEVEAFELLIAARVEAGQLSRAAGKVSAFMMAELVNGQCSHSVDHIAKATGLGESTVQLARRQLVAAGLWERARQLSRLHTAPYWPRKAILKQALEEYGLSSGGVYGHRPIPLARDPLRSPAPMNDDRPAKEGQAIEGSAAKSLLEHERPLGPSTAAEGQPEPQGGRLSRPSGLSLVPAPVVILEDDVQGTLLPAMEGEQAAPRIPASLKNYGGGIIPEDIRRAIQDRKRALAMKQEQVAVAIGISRPQLANALQGRFGLSPSAAMRLVQWLTAGTHNGARRRAA